MQESSRCGDTATNQSVEESSLLSRRPAVIFSDRYDFLQLDGTIGLTFAAAFWRLSLVTHDAQCLLATDHSDQAVRLVRGAALAESIHATTAKLAQHSEIGAALNAASALAMLQWLGIKLSYSRPLGTAGRSRDRKSVV